MHIEDADAVAGELGGLAGVAAEQLIHRGLLAGGEAAAAVPDGDLHALGHLPGGDEHLAPVALVPQPVEKAVLHDGLQDEVRHPGPAKLRIDVILALQLRIAAAHEIHVGLQQLQLVVQGHHGAVYLHAEAEEVHKAHEQIRRLAVAVQLGLDADGVQGVVEEVGVHLAFEVEHGHLLLHQLRAEDVRILQRQVEGEGHEGDARAADEPGGVEALQRADTELNEHRRADGAALPAVQLAPVLPEEQNAEEKVEAHAHIADVGVDAVGVVALGRHGVVDGEEQRPQLRQDQEGPGGPVQPPGLAAGLRHQDGDVLVEEVDHQHHGADEEAVQGVVPEAGDGIQMVHVI